MALVRTNRASAISTANSVTTASFTPSANSLLVACVGGNSEGATPVYTVSGGSLTWTRRKSQWVTDGSGSGWDDQTEIWTAPVGASPSSMTVQVSSTATMDGIYISTYDYTGYNTSSPVGATASGTRVEADGAFSITLDGSPASTSEVIAVGGADNYLASAGAVFTPGSGWTQLYENNTSETFGHVQIRGSSTSTAVAWVQFDCTAGGYGFGTAVAIEIKADAGGSPQSITGTLFTNSQTFPAGTASATYGITGSLLTDGDTFYAGTLTTSYGITGALVTNSQTFPAATASPGAVAVSGALYTNTQSFPAATVDPGAVSVNGALYTNEQTYPAAAVTVGAVTITGALFTNEQGFPAGTATVEGGPQFVTGELVTNEQTFPAAVVSVAGAEISNVERSWPVWSGTRDASERSHKARKRIEDRHKRLQAKWMRGLRKASAPQAKRPKIAEKAVEIDGLLSRIPGSVLDAGIAKQVSQVSAMLGEDNLERDIILRRMDALASRIAQLIQAEADYLRMIQEEEELLIMAALAA